MSFPKDIFAAIWKPIGRGFQIAEQKSIFGKRVDRSGRQSAIDLGSLATALLGFLFFLFFAMSSGFAAEQKVFYGPLLTRSQNPLLLQFIALVPSGTESLPKGRFRVSAETVHSNLFERESDNPGASVDMDMELWRTAFALNYGLGRDFELYVEIPFIATGAGFLDGFIQDYHSTFGFPNGGRDKVNNGRYAYTISNNGTPIYSVDQAHWIPGDWTVSLKHPLHRWGDRFGLAVAHTVKLPIGSRASGGGSGRPDAAVSFIGDATWWRLRNTTQMGFVFLGGHAELEPLLNTVQVQVVETLELKLFKPLSLVAQIQSGTAPFKRTNSNTLGGVPFDLTIGLEGKAFERDDRFFFWQLGFSEDALSRGPSIDFSTTMRVGYEF